MNQLNHQFYLKPEAEQKRFIWKVVSLIIILFAIIFLLSWWKGWYLLIILCPIILMSLASFVDAPSGKKDGTLIYYSPLLIVEKKKEAILNLHGGTLFDYCFVLDRKQNAAERTKFILKSYLEGIVNLIKEYETSDKTHSKVKATSYIINERTAKKAGFKLAKTDGLQNFILLINYIPLTLSYSMSKGKLAFPNLANIKSYECEISDLIANKVFLQNLLKRFNKNTEQKEAVR
ncbi:hypothetical protein [Chondrinema litorale]|uniref:hypothetical protein n=1 Tax=Chondrinema litorale TaxID=2994555 RepID=UPI00254318E7|nr:hypothetical protein [Chondrinema litorale]UZR93814.1 hypothetical protein OQ292_18360 [Chondrinema litorale]